jgi:hypothetical protein
VVEDVLERLVLVKIKWDFRDINMGCSYFGLSFSCKLFLA